jgi:hypothetical protein
VVAVLTLGLLAGLLWLLVLSPRLSETAELQTAAADLELTQISLQRKQRDLDALAAALPEAARQAQQVFARMPQSAQQPRLLRQLTKAATSAGIEPGSISVINTGVPVSVEVDASESGVALATMQVDMTVEGPEAAVLKFLGNLEGLERSLLITAITVDRPDPGPRSPWTASVTGTFFVLQTPLPDLVAAAEKVAAQAGEPAPAPSSPAAAP